MSFTEMYHLFFYGPPDNKHYRTDSLGRAHTTTNPSFDLGKYANGNMHRNKYLSVIQFKSDSPIKRI